LIELLRLMPITILFLGIGDEMKVAVTVYASPGWTGQPG
jgi:hypothetical protein